MAIMPSSLPLHSAINAEEALSNKRKLEVEDHEENTKKQKTGETDGRLHIGNTFELTDEGFIEALQTISPLREVFWDHGFNAVTDQSIASLKASAQTLESLTLRAAGHISEQALCELVEKSSRLISLDLSSCSRITTVFTRMLSNCPHLSKLSLRMCENLTDPGIEQIVQGCSSLTFLDLVNCDILGDQGWVNAAIRGARLLRLETLLLDWSHIGPVGIRALCRITPHLQTLHLEYCASITDEVFRTLPKEAFRSLTDLNLADTSIGNDAINSLSVMQLSSSLRSLNFGCCENINWQILDLLQDFPRLTSLDMRHTQSHTILEDLSPLWRCRQLKILNLSGIERGPPRWGWSRRYCSARDVVRVVQHMPQLEVLYALDLGDQEVFQELAITNPTLNMTYLRDTREMDQAFAEYERQKARQDDV